MKKLLERHQRDWKKCLNPDSNRDPPAYAADCSAVELLRPRSDSRVNQFISSLAALVWGSDRGGPVGEAENTRGRVCVADLKLKRDG